MNSNFRQNKNLIDIVNLNVVKIYVTTVMVFIVKVNVYVIYLKDIVVKQNNNAN